MEELQVEEILKGLKIDVKNISKVLSANSNKSEEEIGQAMHDRTTLNSEEALNWGLVDKIESRLYDEGSELIAIHHQNQPQQAS